MRRNKLKFLTAVILLSLFALAGCQYLKSDLSIGGFPLKEGTQWVYLNEETGDTVIVEVGKKVENKFTNMYDELLYNCKKNKFEKLDGQIVGKEIKLIKGRDFYFNFIVKSGDCYNFYFTIDSVGNYLELYGEFGLKSKIDTIWVTNTEVPVDIVVHYKPFVGFTKIESTYTLKLIKIVKP